MAFLKPTCKLELYLASNRKALLQELLLDRQGKVSVILRTKYYQELRLAVDDLNNYLAEGFKIAKIKLMEIQDLMI